PFTAEDIAKLNNLINNPQTPSDTTGSGEDLSPYLAKPAGTIAPSMHSTVNTPNPDNNTEKKILDNVPTDDNGCAWWSPGTWLPCGIMKIGQFVLWLMSLVLWFAAMLFDLSVNYSLNMAKLLKELPIVNVGWNILRDITNLGYIFILLYVALNMILGTSTYKDKSIIAQIIVTAVLVNFSLFGAKVVVDASNIVAIQFYNLITPANGSNTSAPTGITEQFMQVVNLQSVYSTSQDKYSNASLLTNAGAGTSLSNGSVTGTVTSGGAAPYWRLALLAFVGSVFILGTSVVFFAGAFMFLSRTLTLMFLLMFSSIAFASRALPETEKHFKNWLHKLIDNCIFAPVFVGLLYILIKAMKGVGGTSINFGAMILNGQSISGLVSFCMIMGALVGVLLISKSLGVKGADFAHSFMDKRFGMGNWFGTKGMATRTLGQAATKIAESEAMRSASRFIPIPGTEKFLGSVGKLTGYQDVRDRKTAALKEKDAYLSGVSPQGRWESDAAYKTRKKAAKGRGLRGVGLDSSGNPVTGVGAGVDAVKTFFGGTAYSGYQRGKAKQAKASAASEERKDKNRLSNAKGVGKVLGLEMRKEDPLNPGNYLEKIDPVKEKLAIDMLDAITDGEDLTLSTDLTTRETAYRFGKVKVPDSSQIVQA
ncbi:MAG: hypothetical protein WCO16_03850, partial [bacterium]